MGQPDSRLARVVAVINGKGGSGKSSVTANVAGRFARDGGRTLAIDLDLSGNLALDLGYAADDDNDNGMSIFHAVTDQSPFNVLHGVRDNLDVIPGGKHLEHLGPLTNMAMAEELPGGGVPQSFATALAKIALDYDLIMLDCAPGNPALQDVALMAARYIVIPTKTDPAGWDGLRMVGPRVKRARKSNPDLAYLGVVVFGHSTSATRVLKSTRARLDEVNETVALFNTYIRHSESAAHDCRSRGQLAHELARDAGDRRSERLAALRARGRGGTNDNVYPMPGTLSDSADNLAADYHGLAVEIMTKIIEHETANVDAAEEIQ